MKIRWIRSILVALLLLVAGGYIYWFMTRPVEEEPIYSTKPASLKEIKEMARLATLDFHEEIAVKDQVDGKWIVARMTVEGSVKYDLDSLSLVQRPDTLILNVPAERFEILESTAPSSYEVLDTWDSERPVFGRKLTAAEENAVKKRAASRLENTLRSRGYVNRARENARSVLTPLLRRLAPDSLTVIDIRFAN